MARTKPHTIPANQDVALGARKGGMCFDWLFCSNVNNLSPESQAPPLRVKKAFTQLTHLSLIERRIARVFSEHEHVYEVDENAGCLVGVGRSVGQPLKNHHEYQISEQTQHEHQLRDQHQKYRAELFEVPKGETGRERGRETEKRKLSKPANKTQKSSTQLLKVTHSLLPIEEIKMTVPPVELYI